MTKVEKEFFSETKEVIAVYPMSNWGGIEIVAICYEPDGEYVIYRFNFGEPKEAHKAKIRYGTKHCTFRTYAGYSIRLDECMKVSNDRVWKAR